MKIVYIDALELTHISAKEIFKGSDISLFTKLNCFVSTFDMAMVKERLVIIIDLPVGAGENIDVVKRLILLRILSEGNLKIVLFTDHRKIRFGFNLILITPDLTIDKKTNLDYLHSEIEKIFNSEKKSSYQDKYWFHGYPTLTYSEYRYIMDFMRGKSINEISKITKQSTKAIYTHRRNIFIKYNFKNVTELHAALIYE